MPEQKFRSWQVPSAEESAFKRKDWVTEQMQDGASWFNAQSTTQGIDQYLRLLSAQTGNEQLKSNYIKPDIKKFIETISDIREIGTLGTRAEQLKEIVEIVNHVIQAVCDESQFPMADRKALQWAACANRGYLWPRFIRDRFGWGQGKFRFDDLSGWDVMPSQVPRNGDVQGSYAMTINEFLGVAEAHGRYPRFQDRLLPVASTRPLDLGHVRRLESIDRRRFADQPRWDENFCEINWTFVRDLRINRTGKKLLMGDKGSSWYYEVPTVGDLIVTTSVKNGLPESRLATEEDCRIYPYLRLIITNPGIPEPMYDGTAFDWHGMMPAVQYDVDDWAWLSVGYSLLQDVASIERAERHYIDKMWRVAKLRLNPPFGYDLNAGIPNEVIKRMNILDEEGTHIGTDGPPQAAFGSVIPETMDVRQVDFAMLDRLDSIRQKSLGLNDLSSLEKLKFNLSSDNVDKILETIGPVAKGIAFNMQSSHSKIVQMMKYMIFQYLDTPRAMAYAGPEAVKLQVLDFNPQTIIPSHLPGEETLKGAGTASNFTPIQRAKWAAENLIVTSVPDSLLNVTHMQEQLKWLNLFQQGAPVPFCEVAKQLGIKNWGDSPGATLFEKWKWEKMEMAQAQVEVAQSVAGEVGMTQPTTPQTGANKPNGQGKHGGRPPTAQEPPKLEQRGSTTGHPRTVISQSG